MIMTDRLLIAAAQLNATVGDIEGNTQKLIEARQQAAAQHADIISRLKLIFQAIRSMIWCWSPVSLTVWLQQSTDLPI